MQKSSTFLGILKSCTIQTISRQKMSCQTIQAISRATPGAPHGQMKKENSVVLFLEGFWVTPNHTTAYVPNVLP
jgi:hypothetical protein